MFNGLPGLKFPAGGKTFITKDQMADYLESYAEHFELPVERSIRVRAVTPSASGFRIETTGDTYVADNVVVAMANYQKPKRPAFAPELDPAILQLHSTEYRNPDQLRKGPVLVVGVGNSGADIAIELAASRETLLSGTPTGHVPFPIEGFFGRNLGIRLVRFVGHRILHSGTPMGRKVRSKMLHKGNPLVRVKPHDLTEAGVRWVSRIDRVEDGMPVTTSGERLEVPNVVWCTGYSSGFSWLRVPGLDLEHPETQRGVVPDVPGLFFVGLHFQYAATSDTVTGMPRDARYVVKALCRQATEPRRLSTAKQPATGSA
jgi:putative flavoprotein involved in K+ transport